MISVTGADAPYLSGAGGIRRSRHVRHSNEVASAGRRLARKMEEVNYLYFQNKSMPPLALLVSGSRLSDASIPRIERFIEENKHYEPDRLLFGVGPRGLRPPHLRAPQRRDLRL